MKTQTEFKTSILPLITEALTKINDLKTQIQALKQDKANWGKAADLENIHLEITTDADGNLHLTETKMSMWAEDVNSVLLLNQCDAGNDPATYIEDDFLYEMYTNHFA